MAGPIDLAGFIEAPLIGPANIASNPTVAPMAIPAKDFTALPWTAEPKNNHHQEKSKDKFQNK